MLVCWRRLPRQFFMVLISDHEVKQKIINVHNGNSAGWVKFFEKSSIKFDVSQVQSYSCNYINQSEVCISFHRCENIESLIPWTISSHLQQMFTLLWDHMNHTALTEICIFYIFFDVVSRLADWHSNLPDYRSVLPKYSVMILFQLTLLKHIYVNIIGYESQDCHTFHEKRDSWSLMLLISFIKCISVYLICQIFPLWS